VILWYSFTERSVWRYKRGIQNPYIEVEQTTQWSKEKRRRNKQRWTKDTQKDWVSRAPPKTEVNYTCSGSVSSSCSTSETGRFNLVTNPVISHEWGKDRELFTTSGIYPWSFVTHILHSGQPSHEDFNLNKWNPWFSSFPVSSNPKCQLSYANINFEKACSVEMYTQLSFLWDLLLHIVYLALYWSQQIDNCIYFGSTSDKIFD
jgi:hypothetical protein